MKLPVGPTVIQRLDGLALVYRTPDGTWTDNRKLAEEFPSYAQAQAIASDIPHAILAPHHWREDDAPRRSIINATEEEAGRGKGRAMEGEQKQDWLTQWEIDRDK